MGDATTKANNKASSSVGYAPTAPKKGVIFDVWSTNHEREDSVLNVEALVLAMWVPQPSFYIREDHQLLLGAGECDEEGETLANVADEAFWASTPMYEAHK